MDAEVFDLIVRSRSTILSILKDRGYITTNYENVSPAELIGMARTNVSLLTITAERDPEGNAPMERIHVFYTVDAPIRPSLEKKVEEKFAVTKDGGLDRTKDEIMFVLYEPFHETFHQRALQQWTAHKARVSFYHIKNLISDPAKSVWVPPHRKLTEEEAEALIPALHLRSKFNLPYILYHLDMQARRHGLVPGDIVEIKRPSDTCGEHTRYRVCVA
jgi:DNA-directed RNA polymerase subunit H (RpoH/RPB5)